MSIYCGHISIEGGKITIDLGGKILPDGVYSIIQEAESKRTRKKSKINPTYKPYDKEAFIDSVILAIAGRKITITKLAEEMGFPASTMINRVEKLNLKHLFVLRKSE
jgi:hypothetical protein